MKRFWSKVNKAGSVPPHRPELGPCWVWVAARVRGDSHPRAKLSSADVKEIRRRRCAGEKRIDLADEFGISGRTVRDIVRSVTWLDV